MILKARQKKTNDELGLLVFRPRCVSINGLQLVLSGSGSRFVSEITRLSESCHKLVSRFSLAANASEITCLTLVMKQKFRMYQRGLNGRFYLENNETGKQESLGTSDKTEALRLLHARNEAEYQPAFNAHMARAYLMQNQARHAGVFCNHGSWSDCMPIAQGGKAYVNGLF